MTTAHILIFLIAIAGMLLIKGYIRGLMYCAAFAAVSAAINLYQFQSNGDLREGETGLAVLIFWLFSMFALSACFVGIETTRKFIDTAKKFFKSRVDT